MLVRKAAPEAGSALRGAGELHASAHVHAIRYGQQGSPAYRKAYGQHIGRFLSCMRQFQRGAVSKRGGACPTEAVEGSNYAVGYLVKRSWADPVVQKRFAHVIAKGVLEGSDSLALWDFVENLMKRVSLPAAVDSALVAARVHMHLRDRMAAQAAAI